MHSHMLATKCLSRFLSVRTRSLPHLFPLLLTAWVAFVCLGGRPGQAADTDAYRLGPEDALTISVLRHPEFSGDFLVPPDGMVELPAIGRVAVAGKTVTELTALVTERLKSRLLKPEVRIGLRAMRMQRVYLLGAVKQPGVYDWKPAWRITEALAAAGGIIREPSDCKAILLRAASGARETYAIPAVLQATPQANVALEPGDVLTIEAVEYWPLYVMGEVGKPGLYELRAGINAVEALAQAGGLALPADQVRVSVLRGGRESATLVLTAQGPGTQAAQFALQRGDVLKVDALRADTVMVTGAVKSPGSYQMKATDSVMEILTLAGGLTLAEEDTRVTVMREGREVIARPLKGLGQESAAKALTLQRGDLLKVESLRSISIMVSGKVKTPGAYQLKAGEGLLQALALAGGALPEAALSRVSVVHPSGITELLNLVPAMLEGKTEHDIKLGAGDLVLVPEATARIAILGYVNQPGYFLLPEDKPLTLSDALGMAKGLENKRGGLSAVAVLRNTRGKQERLVVDLSKFLKHGDIASNPVIQVGDIIYVPETKRPDISQIFQAISSVGILLNSAL
jgi:protein involved in polysaccharide export with SLBB domain